MIDTYLGDAGLDKLVEYTVTYKKPGEATRIFTNRVVITQAMTGQAFRAQKRNEVVADRSAHSGFERLGPIDEKDMPYLQVSYEVLARYPRAKGECGKHPFKIPTTGTLLGALDARTSQFGDEFFHFPDFLERRPAPGGTFLSGFIRFVFEKAKADAKTVNFSFEYLGVGTNDHIQWGGGQEHRFFRDRALPIPPLPALKDKTPINEGTLDLQTGKITDLKVNAIFQNTLIGTVDRINLIPFAFPFTIPVLPIDPAKLPAGAKPPEHGAEWTASFDSDAEGNLVGFNMSAKTVEWVTAFPHVVTDPPFKELFAPFSFGPDKSFHFSNPSGYLPGTPKERRPSNDEIPKGIELSLETYFHPHFSLNTKGLVEQKGLPPIPPRLPEAVEKAAVVAVKGEVYVLGGNTESGITAKGHRYHQEKNKWMEVDPLPTPVYGACGIHYEGNVYLIGGWREHGGYIQPADCVQILDLEKGKWKSGKSLLIAVAEAAAGVMNGEAIHVVGGWRLDSDSQADMVIAEAHQIFHIGEGRWKEGRPTPLPVAAASAVVVLGESDGGPREELHVMGGQIADDDEKEHVTNRVSVWVRENDKWEIGEPLGKSIYEGAAGLSPDGRVFVVGGRLKLDGDSTNRMQVRLPADGDAGVTWRNHLRAPVPVAGCGATVFGPFLFVVGGRTKVGSDQSGALTDLVQLFPFNFAWLMSRDKPQFTADDVLSFAAAGAKDPEISPGERCLLVGRNFGEKKEQLEVEVDGKDAQILRLVPEFGPRDGVVDFIVPDDVRVTKRAVIQLKRKGAEAHSVKIPAQKVSPSIYVYRFGELREPAFLQDSNALAQNEDGSLNCPSNPAMPGSELKVFLSGVDRLLEEADRFEVTLAGTGDPLEITGTGSLDPVALLPPADQLPPGTPGIVPTPHLSYVQCRIPDDFETNSFLVKLALKVGRDKANPVVVSIAESAREVTPVPFFMGLFAIFKEDAP